MEDRERLAFEHLKQRLLLKAARKAARKKLRSDKALRGDEPGSLLSQREKMLWGVLLFGWWLILQMAPAIRPELANPVWACIALLALILILLAFVMIAMVRLLGPLVRLLEEKSPDPALVKDFLEEFEKYPDCAAPFLWPSELACISYPRTKLSNEDSSDSFYITDPDDEDDGYGGHNLFYPDMTTLSEEAAKKLSQHKGMLFLSGLTTLSDEAAKALAQHEGWLELNGLTTLSDKAAHSLGRHKGHWLSLNGLTTLSDEMAKALAQHKGGWLHLNGLTTLSDEAAKALTHYEGDLHLNGLTTLSDEAAMSLAPYEDDVYFTDQTEVLANHNARLYLEGMTTLSCRAAMALRSNSNIRLPDKFK